MKLTLLRCLVIAGIWMHFAPARTADVPQRKDIPVELTWDLTDLYPTDEAWTQAYQKLFDQKDEVTSFKGHLTDDPATLLKACRFISDFQKEITRLAVYAFRIADQDLRVSKHQEKLQKMQVLFTAFAEGSAFVTPELLAADEQTVRDFMRREPKLEEFSVVLEDILRTKAHALPEAQEAIMASAGLVTGNAGQIYNVFSDAEMPRPEVTLSTGEKVTLSDANYVKYRGTGKAEDRAKIFEAFWNNYAQFKNTYGTIQVAELKNHFFVAKNRKYASCLAAALDGNNIPVEFYANHIKQIRANLNTLHRYLELKRQLLGLQELHYSDLYAPIVEQVDLTFSVDDARRILKEVLAPLGPAYTAIVDQAFADRWIDFMPNQAKRSGAYSSGSAYDVHPYMLMNWNDDYDALSTLAHELGHCMHSYLTNQNQPYAKSNYGIFVAEIASTFNENLLFDYMVKNAKSDKEKLYLLGSYLEQLRQTIFRQTQFAEFEWEIHKAVERGEPLTGETLNKRYLDMLRAYYGHDQGVCIVDDTNANEWMLVSQFYRNFYVYQYATSQIYSTAFSKKVLDQGEPAVKAYMKLLKGGNAQYPLDLIKTAGLDPLSSEAFDLTMKKMNEVMDQIAKIAGI